LESADTLLKVISGSQLPFVTLVCVDDVNEPTQELKVRVDANIAAARVL